MQVINQSSGMLPPPPRALVQTPRAGTVGQGLSSLSQFVPEFSLIHAVMQHHLCAAIVSVAVYLRVQGQFSSRRDTAKNKRGCSIEFVNFEGSYRV
jgi:hypothetical protein